MENEGALGGPRFCPPLYQQRYSLVISVCRRIRAEKVEQCMRNFLAHVIHVPACAYISAHAAIGNRRGVASHYNVGYELSGGTSPCVQVVDVGCGEGKLLRLLRREGSVQELVGVDIQASLLETQQHTLQPLTTDYLLPREQPLTVWLMQGVCTYAHDMLTD